MPFPARRLGGESAADAERRTRAMKPVYASVYLTSSSNVYTTLAATANAPESDTCTICTPTDDLTVNINSESTAGVVSSKANTFGFVVPRTGVYRVCASYHLSLDTYPQAGVFDHHDWTLQVMQNDKVIAVAGIVGTTQPARATVSVDHIVACNSADKFTFHLRNAEFVFSGGSWDGTITNLPPSSGSATPYHYFSLHNVD